MSSFRKRTAGRGKPLPPLGTRVSPYNSSVLLSTGIASLDDILGGGCPLGSVLLLAEDEETSYAKLVLKYWVAQGLCCSGQQVVLVSSGLDRSPEQILSKLPLAESDAADASASAAMSNTDDEDEALSSTAQESMRIAFRYEGLKKFETSVESSNKKENSTFCSTFDLTKTMHLSTFLRTKLHCLDIEDNGGVSDGYTQAVDHLANALQSLANAYVIGKELQVWA